MYGFQIPYALFLYLISEKMQKSNVTSFLRVALKASPYKRRHVFESKEIAGKIRINIASFEKWYANQIKYHKVIGEEPGKELKSWSYSVKERNYFCLWINFRRLQESMFSVAEWK